MRTQQLAKFLSENQLSQQEIMHLLINHQSDDRKAHHVSGIARVEAQLIEVIYSHIDSMTDPIDTNEYKAELLDTLTGKLSLLMHQHGNLICEKEGRTLELGLRECGQCAEKTPHEIYYKDAQEGVRCMQCHTGKIKNKNPEAVPYINPNWESTELYIQVKICPNDSVTNEPDASRSGHMHSFVAG
ncbi:hypothetical protein [Neptuniibacter sp. QD37_11]|uniref:hypothetical protein n=1 Tax=Neptuniibacter sp. QD37_11 TaxID=3398209 RepID=UPI0039F4A9BC